MRVERFATTLASGASVDEARREFEGIACAFNVRSEGGGRPTVFKPGAFAKTLKEQGARVKVLWQHDTSEPLGRPLWIRETDAGLLFRARLDDTSRGRDALKLLRSGTLNEISVGIDVIKSRDSGDVREIVEARLWEFSLVTFGAVPGSTVFRFEGTAPTYREARPKALSVSMGDKLATIAEALVSTTHDPAIPPRR